MIRLKGQGASGGYAIGTLRFFSEEGQNEKEQQNVKGTEGLGNPGAELIRFEDAKAKAIEELEALAKKLSKEGLKDAALLMETHSLLAADPDYTDSTTLKINDGASAESAVFNAGEEFAMLFESSGSPELAARAADIRDVSKRIKNILAGKDTASFPKESCILAADDLSPSQLASVNKEMLLAIICQKGSALGHTAIIAGSFGIPAVMGTGSIDKSLDNKTVIADGFTGDIFIDPDEETLKKYKELMNRDEKDRLSLKEYIGLSDETKDGKKIKLYCNIQSPDDISAVFENDGKGIGLFRSEFLFMGRNTAPTEDEQFEAYRKALVAMKDAEVVIRTMDIGSDKNVPYLETEKEENPALGLRGIRLSLAKPGLFKTQLRALYRASVFGNLSVMFPMVSDIQELRKAKEICREVTEELKAEGREINEKLPIGIMIETPAAALISNELAKEADFFSIGSNDLTQYTLAADRTGTLRDEFCDTLHKSVLILIEMTIKNARKEGIPVGICGELAADPRVTKELIDMGIDELSVAPKSVPAIRREIRSL